MLVSIINPDLSWGGNVDDSTVSPGTDTTTIIYEYDTYLYPKWNGTAWYESATPEEIQTDIDNVVRNADTEMSYPHISGKIVAHAMFGRKLDSDYYDFIENAEAVERAYVLKRNPSYVFPDTSMYPTIDLVHRFVAESDSDHIIIPPMRRRNVIHKVIVEGVTFYEPTYDPLTGRCDVAVEAGNNVEAIR